MEQFGITPEHVRAAIKGARRVNRIDLASAEDAAQDALLRLLRRGQEFSPGLAHIAAFRRALVIRKKRERRGLVLLGDDDEKALDERVSAEDAVDADEEVGRLLRTIAYALGPNVRDLDRKGNKIRRYRARRRARASLEERRQRNEREQRP